MNTNNKKNQYPSKRTLNLYYKEDRATRPATISLYVLFVLVVFLALGKLLVYDITVDLHEARQNVEQKQNHIDAQLVSLKEYNTISAKYSRYSSSYLHEDEIVCNRLEVLKMIEEVLLPIARVEKISISGEELLLEVTNPNLEQIAGVADKLETYDIVDSVFVKTARKDDKYETRIYVQLHVDGKNDLLGGEQ